VGTPPAPREARRDPPETIAALANDELPDGLGAMDSATVQAVDQIAAGEEIAEPIQRVLVDSLGDGGVVEFVVLCGLYALMGYVTAAFAIEVEPGLVALEG
jgi:hypothetical protein